VGDGLRVGREILPDRYPDGCYSVAGAAKRFGVKLDVVHAWIKRGLVKGERKDFRAHRRVCPSLLKIDSETALHVIPFRCLDLGLSGWRSLSAKTRVNLGAAVERRPPSPLWWTIAHGGLPHNHHKPRLAGYEPGGSE
jgi:hypothetical protein